jgi:hypothetical protein
MKKLITLSLLFFSFTQQAQTSFSVSRQSNSLAVSPNATIDLVTSPNNPITIILDVTNTSTVTKSYHVKRYNLLLHSTASATADANFYFGGNDYAPSTATSMIPLTLSPNQNSGTMGTYYSLGATLTEANTVGFSRVKYTVFNTAQASDSLQFTLRYNQPNAVNISAQSLISMPLQISPSPVKDLAKVTINAGTNLESKLSIFNSLGEEVFEQTFPLVSGKNMIPLDLSEFTSGIYFVQVKSAEGLSTRKIIVE